MTRAPSSSRTVRSLSSKAHAFKRGRRRALNAFLVAHLIRVAERDIEQPDVEFRDITVELGGGISSIRSACGGEPLLSVRKHLPEQYPDPVVRPIVERFGGIWLEDEPVVVDDNLISSRHPDDMPHFIDAIRAWLLREEGVR
jgi:hypothetical protein